MANQNAKDLHGSRDTFVHTLGRTISSRSAAFAKPISGLQQQRSSRDSITRQLLLKDHREKEARSYRHMLWQLRTMDDHIDFDIGFFSDSADKELP